MNLRPAAPADHEAVWRIFREVLAAGETYALDPAMPRDAALAWWFRADGFPGVAEEDGKVLGAWFLRPNHPGPGAHIANGGFIVAAEARGRGVGRRMGEHFLAEARRLGFRGVQFNFVVSTNERAVRLWRELGFAVAGTLPGVFRHPTRGFVDALVMFRSLAADGD